jgi:ATP synthase F1 gamma subunit
MLKDYDPVHQDIIIIGHHGAVQLMQAGVNYKKYFKLPKKDQNINVAPLVREVRQYRNAVVYYQTYQSLMSQEIKRIALSQAVQEEGKKSGPNDEIISEVNYIFEPSAYAVVAHLERTMLEIALSQVILDSKLAQYASRFRAMSVANDKSNDSLRDLRMMYNRSKRWQTDEHLKEVVNGAKKARLQ